MTMTIKRAPEPERVVKFGKSRELIEVGTIYNVDPANETKEVITSDIEPTPVIKPKPRLRKRKPAPAP